MSKHIREEDIQRWHGNAPDQKKHIGWWTKQREEGGGGDEASGTTGSQSMMDKETRALLRTLLIERKISEVYLSDGPRRFEVSNASLIQLIEKHLTKYGEA